MPLKCVVLALLLCCSLATCEPQKSSKDQFYKNAWSDEGNFFDCFWKVLTSNATKEQLWETSSHSNSDDHKDPPDTTGDFSFSCSFIFFSNTMYCVLDPSNTDFFGRIFQEYLSATPTSSAESSRSTCPKGYTRSIHHSYYS
jgi:hypothetical protein